MLEDQLAAELAPQDYDADTFDAQSVEDEFFDDEVSSAALSLPFQRLLLVESRWTKRFCDDESYLLAVRTPAGMLALM